MQWIKRILCAVLTVCLAIVPALAEDEEISIEDTAGSMLMIEESTYDGVAWNFPIDLSDMDPEMIRLANKHVLLEKDFVPDKLVKMKARKAAGDGSNANGGVKKASGSEMQLQEECAEALVRLLEAGLEEGVTLYLKSAYRSYRTQATMYENRLKKNNGKDDGWVSKPGASDHQTGLGCDVVPGNWRDRGMNEKMAKEEECQWMAQRCAEFGFIIRYPADKEDVTEINYEPWHLRYVGVPVATYIMENGLTLEEFHEQLHAAIEEFLLAGGPRSVVEEFIQTPAEEK